MFRSFRISRFISGVLLVIFALGITPKRFVHDLTTKHIDNSLKKTNHTHYQLSKSGYNCDCDNLVAESIFVTDQQVFSFPLSTSFSDYSFKEISFYSISKTYTLLRGPPVNI
ncbi:MAG: hypothetical protein ABIN97_08230 [Ginsengibacter sp.]